MTNPVHKAKAGTLMMIDSGCYSDYGVQGFFVVLQDFVPLEQIEEYRKTPKPADWTEYQRQHFQQYEFMAWLLAKGFILEIQFDTFHLGDYSGYDEISFTPHTADGEVKQ